MIKMPDFRSFRSLSLFVYTVILAVFLLPLFLLNILPEHDWGGDFAQYIQQTINMVEGKTQNDTYYLFNPYNPYLGPPAYSIGFPLMLAPVYCFFGNNIVAFSAYLTLLLIGAFLLMFRWLSNYVAKEYAVVGVLILAYNPWVLSFKGEILADIPLLFLVMLTLTLYKKITVAIETNEAKQIGYYFLLGFVLALAMLVKSIAVVILFALIVDLLIFTTRKRVNRSHWLILSIIPCFCLIIYGLFGWGLFPLHNESYTFFASLFDFGNLGDTWLKTTAYYIEVFQWFFHPYSENWAFLSLLTKASFLFLLTIGLLNNCLEKFTYKEGVILAYLGVVISFPNTSQGFRYLLPMLPLFAYHAICGLKYIRMTGKWNKKMALVFFCIGIFLPYKDQVKKLAVRSHLDDGPQHPESIAVFEFIKNNTEEDAVFVFCKPRVLGLYTQRKAFANDASLQFADTEKQLDTLNHQYILVSKVISDEVIMKYVSDHVNYNLIFANDRFALYKKFS